jgi:hypothetical protein
VELPLRHRHVGDLDGDLDADLDDDWDDEWDDDDLVPPPLPAPGVRRHRHLGVIDGGRLGA